MICVDCDQPVTRHGDNRYRGCSICGWRMHHGCWSGALGEGRLPCPKGEPYTIEFNRLVATGEGVTPTGKPKRQRQIQTITGHEDLEGHGDVMGMLGEWEC
jgi:hypothetical protein